MMPWLKTNSGSKAHTSRLHRNSMSAPISRYFRESAHPSRGVWRQTPCSPFPMATLLSGVLWQANPTNSFSRILKIIEIMKS